MYWPSVGSSARAAGVSCVMRPPYITRIRSLSARISDKSDDTSNTARPASRSPSRRRWMNSTAPKSTPRVGWAANTTRAPRVSSRAGDAHRAAARAAEPRERLGQLVLTVALDAGDPHDLAGAHHERYVPHGLEAASVAHRDVVHLEQRLARRARAARVQRRD